MMGLGERNKKSSSNNKSRQTGASRTQKGESASPLFTVLKASFKYLVALSFVGGVVAVIYVFSPKEKLRQFTHNPIEAVLIECRFDFYNREEAEAIISDQVTGSFIDLDIQKLKYSLEESPWVDSVTITREWPDKLVIKIEEQQAIARWGANKILNIRGDIISVKNIDKMDELPFLNGNDSYAKDVMQQYLKMGKLLNQYQITLKSIELDDTLSWTLTINDNIKVKLGRDRLWGKLQNLIEAKKGSLNSQFTNIGQIDMRYPSGFAISWKQIQMGQHVAEG